MNFPRITNKEHIYICYDDKCQSVRVKGTKRKVSRLVTENKTAHQMKPPTTTSLNKNISDSVNDKPIKKAIQE